MRRLHLITTYLVLLSSAFGCGVFRGIPTHGGGKRFDEEQRVVASAIRQTLADMDLSDLENKKVQIVLECIAQDGGGTVIFPGFSSLNAGIGANVGEGNFVRVIPSGEHGPNFVDDSASKGASGNVGIGYQLGTTYSPSAMSSTADLSYLRASLEMKARHGGLMLVGADPDVVLFVLVDVLGTNRSKTDKFVSSVELLAATCECTYYAIDARSNHVLFEARRAASHARYRESRAWGVEGAAIERQTERIEPTPLPVEEPHKPATQPAIVRARKTPIFGLAGMH